MAPGVPADRLAALRKAFNAAVNSDALRAEASKRSLEINPKTGAELDDLFAKYGTPSPAIAAHVAMVMGVTH